MKLVWSIRARNSLRNIIKYIGRDYPLTAEKVRVRIIETAETILPHPEKYAAEEILKDIGNIRFRAVWNYKIVYLIKHNQVVILDIFDSMQHPEKLKDSISG